MATRADKIVDDALAAAGRAQSNNQNSYQSSSSGYGGGGDAGWSTEDVRKAEREKTLAAVSSMVGGMTGEQALQVGRKALNAYIQDEAEPIHKDFMRVKERFEVLEGTRSSKALGQRAVRFDNIRALANIPSQPKASRRTINPNPTMEEFNALFDDMRVLYNALFELATQISAHGTSK